MRLLGDITQAQEVAEAAKGAGADGKSEEVISNAKKAKRLVSNYEYEIENIQPDTVNAINEARDSLEQTLAQHAEETLTIEATVAQLANQLQQIAQQMAPNASATDTSVGR
jgi:hypothetical protein